MWKKIFGTAFPASQPPQDNGDDADDGDTEEDDGLDQQPGIDDWDALEENDFSWICRACMKPIDSVADNYQECGRAKVHRACLMCSICQTPLQTHMAHFLKGSVWPYCSDCLGLAQLEAKLRQGAEMWGIGILPAPAPPPEDPLADFNTLRDLCHKVLPPNLADEVCEVLEKKAGITGEGQEWRNKLYDKVLDKDFFRLPLTKTALSHVHQAVQPREGPTAEEPKEERSKTLFKIKGTAASALDFVQQILTWETMNLTLSGTLDRENISKCLWQAPGFLRRILGAQILKKALQLGIEESTEEIKSLRSAIDGIRSLLASQERNAGLTQLNIEIPPDGRDLQGALPRDICKLILGCLDYSSLLDCRLVNRWWRALADDDSLWMQLFQREWGARKLLSQTWQSAFIEMYKEMSFMSEDRRIIRRLGPIDPVSTLAVGNWCLLGLTRQHFKPPPAIPGFRHPASTPGVTLNLQISLQGLLDVADLELGSRACETSSCLRDKRVVTHMLNRYSKWMQLRTMYPDAVLVPTDDIALVWISHLIRPKLYEADCKKLYGVIVPHESITDRALDIMFWSALKQTEELWRKHFNTDYSLRPPGYTQEAEDNVSFRQDIVRDGIELPPAEPGYYENFATGGKAHDDPDTEEILEVAVKEQEKEPNWQNPFSISVEDVMGDRLWAAHFERFMRCLSGTQFSSIHAYICAKALKCYEKFLYLQIKYPDVELVPNYLIQLAIRGHTYNPLAYREDMLHLFGKVVAFDPCPGPEKMLAFQRTRELWQEEYGTSMDTEVLNCQVDQENKHRQPQEDTLEKKIQTENEPEDVCSVFIKKSVPVLPSVQVALDNNFCTYSATGLDFAIQTYMHCETCIDEGRFTEDEGVCATCARVCHLGHEMSEQVSDRPFFCDCGPSGHCNCLAPADWKPPVSVDNPPAAAKDE